MHAHSLGLQLSNSSGKYINIPVSVDLIHHVLIVSSVPVLLSRMGGRGGKDEAAVTIDTEDGTDKKHDSRNNNTAADQILVDRLIFLHL